MQNERQDLDLWQRITSHDDWWRRGTKYWRMKVGWAVIWWPRQLQGRPLREYHPAV